MYIVSIQLARYCHKQNHYDVTQSALAQISPLSNRCGTMIYIPVLSEGLDLMAL